MLEERTTRHSNVNGLLWENYGAEIFTDRPRVTLNHRQLGPHAQNSRSNGSTWCQWTQPWLSRATHTPSIFALHWSLSHSKTWEALTKYGLLALCPVNLGLQPLIGVNFCFLIICTSLVPTCLLGDWIASLKKRFTLNSSCRLTSTWRLCNSLMAQRETLAVDYLTQVTDRSQPRFT